MGYLAIGTYIDEHELKMIKNFFVHKIIKYQYVSFVYITDLL